MKSIFQKSLILCLLASFLTSCNMSGSSYNILNYGASGECNAMNTTAINKAIKDCNSHGGGTVVIPAGTFVSGTIILLSNVELHLEPGAELLGSKDTCDYLLMKHVLFEGGNRLGLLYAINATNISITGQGTINGNGACFMNFTDKTRMGGNDFDRKFIRQGEEFMKKGTIFEDGPVSYAFRPGFMIFLEQCENVHLNDILVKDSPVYAICVADCENVNVKGIIIDNNPLIPNNDGIHCTNSRKVCISDCNIVAGDDAIIVTGFGSSPAPTDPAYKVPATGNKTGYAENITITNCVLSSRSACIRIGYGHHPIRNLVFSNLVMVNSNRGIGIFARDNSAIENVLFSNIIIHTRLYSGHWWGKGEPIHISAIKASKVGRVGQIRNIRFSNIIATGETGILISGDKESIIEDILLDHVQLSINTGRYSETYGGNFDFRPAYPIDRAIFKHEIPGLYAQFVKNLTISNFELNWGTSLPCFFTNGIEVQNFENLTINGFAGKPAYEHANLTAISLSDGTNAQLLNCRALDASPLVRRVRVR